ncbi:MAG: threonine synthase [Bacteroidales bacterium]|nr:threonine synthase [Bacteroidales bacterium]
MKFYSTNHKSEPVTFREAVIQGLADDKGLFYPESIPELSASFFEKLPKLSLGEIAFEFLKPYVGKELSDGDLKSLLDEALNFDIPLVELEKDEYALELFHGPTMAFKDVGARTMARFLSNFTSREKVTILVATSGDTGSAVAQGFYNVEGIDVVVLYPKNQVSNIQEKQFTTLGGNITALEVNGTFDDCQRMVKAAFVDSELKQKIQLSSANSINIARLLPQAVYYFYAYGQLKNHYKPLVISVPSGNYGNLTAGLIAKKSGLPVDRFIAAANRNDVVPEYFSTGIFRPRPSIATISNAMDVGDPSNFARMLEMYSGSLMDMRGAISAYSFTDQETTLEMKYIYRKFGYILDPHGAVAHLGLSAYMKNHDVSGVFLETAHPAKFKETVEQNLPVKVEIPEQLKTSLEKKKLSIEISDSSEDLKQFLLNRQGNCFAT